MRTIETSPVSSDELAVEVRRELHRARLGRVLANYVRREATSLERQSAVVARAAGVPVAEIARAQGVSVPRIYQLLASSNRKDLND